MNDVTYEFSQRLRALRKLKNQTQQQVSDFLHLNRSTYAYYESGKASPSLQTLVLLSEYYEVSTDFLLKGD
ncbi:MAG: helix-turn-helix transcriptional regulator [Clostridiales bacterium]|jgi:transcriptional regulator with XRE-family HTH domain|nr:helix-turn-helix transcriptional regulator [Clostridiales bacterium]